LATHILSLGDWDHLTSLAIGRTRPKTIFKS
jgi:hypothetical protein